MPITRLGFAGYGVKRAGSFAGKSASIVFDASAASFAVTGQAATFAINANAASGSYSITGIADSFDTMLSAGVGGYVITGVAADLLADIDYTLSAASAAYSISGSAASLLLSSTGKSGVSRLSSIESQRAADRQKKRRVTYAVDAIEADAKQNKAVASKEKQVISEQEARPTERHPAQAVEYDTAKDTLAAIDKSIQRRKEKDAAKTERAELAEATRTEEIRKLAAVEARQQIEADAKAKADAEKAKAAAKARASRQAKAIADKSVYALLSPLLDAKKAMRAKVEADVRQVEGIGEVEIQSITDKALGAITTDDILAMLVLEAEKRQKKAMLKMLAMLS